MKNDKTTPATAGSSANPTVHDSDLMLAQRLSDVADAISLSMFQSRDLGVAHKSDLTPVTDADTAVENVLRALLAKERPNDAVHGEERGGTLEGVDRCWVIDPIDGTKNYSHGLPVWATLIALVADGKPVVGIASAPALNRRWWAASGQGAWVSEGGGEGRRLSVSDITELTQAYVSTTDLRHWTRLSDRRRWLRLTEASWESRAFGDFWQHVLVAEGCLDIAAEVNVKPWDLAALVPIVTEAGGRFTDHTGAETISGGSALSSNGHLHDAALEYINPHVPVETSAGSKAHKKAKRQ